MREILEELVLKEGKVGVGISKGGETEMNSKYPRKFHCKGPVIEHVV